MPDREGQCQVYYPDWEILLSRLEPYSPNEDTNTPQFGNHWATTAPHGSCSPIPINLFAAIVPVTQLIHKQQNQPSSNGKFTNIVIELQKKKKMYAYNSLLLKRKINSKSTVVGLTLTP